MQIMLTILFFGLCLAGMASGLIFAKKILRKGCSDDPDACRCRNEGKDPSTCDK